METAVKVAIGVVAVGAGLWALAGSAGAATTTVASKPDGKTQGGTDGCAAGTADAKAGKPAALNPTDDDGVRAAARATTDPVAYLAEFQTRYDACWTSTPKPGGGGGGGGEKPTSPPPGATGPDRAKALEAWGLGCDAGTDAGYAAGYAGSPAPTAPSGAAVASGNVAAYRAAFDQAKVGAYAAGSGAAGLPGYEPGSTHASALLAGGKGACSGYFDGWWLKWLAGGAKTSGVQTAALGVPCAGCRREVGVGGLMRLRAAPRVTRRAVAGAIAIPRRAGRKTVPFDGASHGGRGRNGKDHALDHRDEIYTPR
jgi:hypothetical protein